MWGLIDPASLHKEYLSQTIPITRDVYIPCNRNKSDKKNDKKSVKINEIE